MGFTREFAWSKTSNAFFKRIGCKGDKKEYKLGVEQATQKYILNGSQNAKDTKVVTNNVTVSFLCLKLAAARRWGWALQRNFKKISV